MTRGSNASEIEGRPGDVLTSPIKSIWRSGPLINKDVVRRILAQHYRPRPTEGGPSWLTFIGPVKDGLWSLDLFRCESIILRTYWVLGCVSPPEHSINEH